jgi:hypothetical protein
MAAVSASLPDLGQAMATEPGLNAPLAAPMSAADLARRTWVRIKARLATTFKPHEVLLHGPADAFAQAGAIEPALQAFAQWCEAHQGSACELGLSSRWLISSAAPVGWTQEAVREHVLRQWEHYFGLDTAQLEQDWVLRQVITPQAAVVCAAPRALIDGLRDAAAAQGVQVLSVGPWWARGVQAWLASLADQAAREGNDAKAEAAEPWRLTLSEPGLLTHVQTRMTASASESASGMPLAAQLGELWTEASDARVQPGLVGRHQILVLQAPSAALADQAEREPQAWQRHVWSHPELRPLLCGDAPAWATVWQATP